MPFIGAPNGEEALPHCTALYFLNPGVDACVKHCRSHPWEPAKFATQEAQTAVLSTLIEWVRDYESHDDEYGLQRHRRIFDGFPGAKLELTTVASYARMPTALGDEQIPCYAQ
jgi:hypothetical protein